MATKKNDTTTQAAEKAQTVSLNSDVRITFVERENSPERLVCEAELVFGTVGEYTLEELQRTAMQHAELVDALEAHDPAWARSAMATHLLTARNAMMRSVRRPRRPGGAEPV